MSSPAHILDEVTRARDSAPLRGAATICLVAWSICWLLCGLLSAREGGSWMMLCIIGILPMSLAVGRLAMRQRVDWVRAIDAEAMVWEPGGA